MGNNEVVQHNEANTRQGELQFYKFYFIPVWRNAEDEQRKRREVATSEQITQRGSQMMDLGVGNNKIFQIKTSLSLKSHLH